MRKPVLMLLGMVLVITMIAAGCASPVTTTTTVTTTQNPTIKNGGTLRIGWQGWPAAGLNPFLASDEDDYVFLSPIYEPLAMPLADGTVQPWIAKTWNYDATQKEWIFHLDPAAHWSDGVALTANDVKFTFDTCWKYETDMASQIKPYISAVEVIDTNTVGFKMAQDCAPFLTMAGGVLIMPQHLWSTVGDVTKYDNTNPVGSGPFVFKSVQKGQFLDLLKDPNYWKGAAHVNEVIIEVLLNDEASVAALLKGEVDVLPSMTTYTLIPTIEASKYGRVEVEENPHILYIAPNWRIYPLNLLAVRQAIDYALDKQTILNDALSGYAVMPLMGYIAPSVTAWANTNVTWEGLGMTNDDRIAKANALLDGLGFKKGTDGIRTTDIQASSASTTKLAKLEFNLYLYNNASYVRAAGLIKDQLALIGIKIDITVYDPGTLYGSIIFGGEHPNDWNLLLHGSFTSADPKDLALQYAPANPSSWDNGPAFGWPEDPATTAETQLVTLLQKTMVDTDPTVRYNDVQAAQQQFADQLIVITLGHKEGIGLYTTQNFSGWNPVPVSYSAMIHSLSSLQNLLSVYPK